MELWVLGLGAGVLVLLALWVVTRTPESPREALAVSPSGAAPGGTSDSSAGWRAAEVEAARGDLSVGGEAFEDRFTAATADLSAGAVAEAVEEMREETESSAVGVEAPGFGESTWSPGAEPPGDQTPPYRVWGAMVFSLGFLGAVVAGAWIYLRRRRECNRPVNRLRRRFRAVAREVGDRVPDATLLVERLPEAEVTRPAGGIGLAALIGALLGWRLLRGNREQPVAELVEKKTTPVAEGGAATAGQIVDELRTRWGRISFPSEAAAEATKRASSVVEGLGATGAGARFAGLLAAGAAGYLVWRLVRGGHRDEWYVGAGSPGAAPAGR